MDFSKENKISNIKNSNTINIKEKKKRKFKFRYILLIFVVIIIYYIVKYNVIITDILNPKQLGSSISKNVTLTNQYNLNGQLYFVKNNNLWRIAGITSRQITHINNVSDIAVSKNGKKVSYVSFHTNYSNLHQMNINGTNDVRITNWSNPNINNNVWSATPAYSPNGQYISYLANIGKQITGVPIAGLGVWMIHSNSVFTSYYNQVYNEANLITPTSYTGGDADLTWPNNNYLLYTYYIYYTNTPQPNSQIMLYDFSTQQSYPVTPVASNAMEPRLSPNGKYLAYTRRIGNNSNYLYIMDFNLNSILNNTENSSFNTYKSTSQLVNAGVNSQPTWSPNGNHLAFISLNNNSFDIALKSIKYKSNKLLFGSLKYLTVSSNVDSTSKMYWL